MGYLMIALLQIHSRLWNWNKKIQPSWQTSALAMHLLLARLVSMPVIFCLLPSSSIVRPPGMVVPDGLLFYRRCFLASHISEAPRPIAAKICHMIAIWLESPAKVGQVGSPLLKNFRSQKHAKFPSIFCNVRFWPRISPEQLNISKS